MEAQINTKTGQITFKLVGEQIDLFEGFAKVQEVFMAERSCGLCDSTELQYRVREVDGNKYFELHCECGARFSFGQHKATPTLFPKRKDKDGNWLPNRGWSKYQKGDQ